MPEGTHLQVKSRVVFNPRVAGQRQLSSFQSLDFDALVVVLLSAT